MPFGTLGVLDTLAASNTTSIIKFGEDRAYEAVAIALAAHDRILAEMVAELVEPTTDRLRRTGGNSSLTAQDLDEYGIPAPQKMAAGANVGFPLRRTGNALQWTRDWLNTKTPAELAAQTYAIMDADRRIVQRNLKRAVFYSTNLTFNDDLVDGVALPVKRLANADGHPIPPDPNGNNFIASTHTHYLARAGGALAASDVTALENTVVEHFAAGTMELYISATDETTFRALTGFQPYYDPRLTLATTTTRGSAALDVINVNDRAIGIFGPAEVWVKPWVPANYLYCYMYGAGITAPVAARTRDGQGLGNLELVADWDQYPLRANIWRRDLGFAVQNRISAAVLYFGGTTYSDPVLS